MENKEAAIKALTSLIETFKKDTVKSFHVEIKHELHEVKKEDGKKVKEYTGNHTLIIDWFEEVS